MIRGTVDDQALCKNLSPTEKGCKEKIRRIEKYEKRLRAYFQELSEGIAVEENIPRSRFPTLWIYDFFNAENYPLSSDLKVKMTNKERNKRIEEFLSPFSYQIDSQKYTHLSLLGWHPKKPGKHAYFGKPKQNIQFIMAPSDKFTTTPLGVNNYRYVLFQIDEKKKDLRAAFKFSRERVLLKIAHLFFPQCWGLWRYYQVKEEKPKVLSDDLENVDISGLKDEYFSSISREADFREYALNIKSEIAALHTLMSETRRLPNATLLTSSPQKKQYFSDKLISSGKRILEEVRKHLDIGEKIFQRNIEGITNLFSAKVALSNNKLQHIAIVLAVVSALSFLMPLFKNLFFIILRYLFSYQ